MGDITKLNVWEMSHKLAVDVYKQTQRGELAKDYSLRDQIRRAAISTPSNIAEGEESGFNKLGIRYFYIAKASLAELKTQLLIANKISYLSDDTYQDFHERIEILSKQLRKLIKFRTEYVKKHA